MNPFIIDAQKRKERLEAKSKFKQERQDAKLAKLETLALAEIGASMERLETRLANIAPEGVTVVCLKENEFEQPADCRVLFRLDVVAALPKKTVIEPITPVEDVVEPIKVEVVKKPVFKKIKE